MSSCAKLFYRPNATVLVTNQRSSALCRYTRLGAAGADAQGGGGFHAPAASTERGGAFSAKCEFVSKAARLFFVAREPGERERKGRDRRWPAMVRTTDSDKRDRKEKVRTGQTLACTW